MLYRLALIVPYLYSECAASDAANPYEDDALFFEGIDFDDHNGEESHNHVAAEDGSSDKSLGMKSRDSPPQNDVREPKMRKTAHYAESEKAFAADEYFLRDLGVFPDEAFDDDFPDTNTKASVAKPRLLERLMMNDLTSNSPQAALKVPRDDIEAFGPRKGHKPSSKVPVNLSLSKGQPLMFDDSDVQTSHTLLKAPCPQETHLLTVNRKINNRDKSDLERFYAKHIVDIGAFPAKLAQAFLLEHRTGLVQSQARSWFRYRVIKDQMTAKPSEV